MSASAEIVQAADVAAWELPPFSADVFAERTGVYALVIPVIKAGKHVRDHLLRIRAAGLPVDLVVAVDGSIDAALDPAFVSGANVRATLTTSVSDGLSAQLRVAYAWCLREGYAGIVTLDGSGSEQVAAVAALIARLEEGDDCVLGSRALSSDRSENMLLKHRIANRLLPAPLLYLAKRHWIADTANGFSAFSARFLLDPRVQPFRGVFQRDELPLYLAVRARQIGMKVGEVPLLHRTSPHTSAPTLLQRLRETVTAVTGGFTPEPLSPAQPRMHGLTVLFVLLATLPFLFGSMVSPTFSSDSWAYYELGQTVFGDFYRFSHFRTYGTTSPYATSFPPLFPALIALVDTVTNAGARSGYFAAFAAFAVFALLSEQIGRRAFGVAWLGLGIALVLLLGPAMVLDEMRAGRAIPLQLVLFAALVLCLLEFQRMTVAHAVGVGVFAGLALLNRFDAVLLPVLAAASVWLLTRRASLALVTLLSAGVVVSPWIAYSLTTFGVPFATDNSGVALSLDRSAFVTDWWPTAQPTLRDDPLAWVGRILQNLVGFADALTQSVLNRMGWAFTLAFTPIVVLQALTQRRFLPSRPFQWVPGPLSVVALFPVISLLLLVPQMLTGYSDLRYFTALVWSVFLLIAGWLVRRGQSAQQRQVFATIMFTVLCTVVFVAAGNFLVRAATTGRLDISRWPAFTSPANVTGLVACVGDDSSARILVLGNNLFAARAGALSGLHTMFEPRNMADGRLDPEGSRAFLAAWNVTYVLVVNEERLLFAETTFSIEPAADCPLKLFSVVE